MQIRGRSEVPWKSVALALAVILIVVLICAVLVVAGVMNLGFSLL